MLSVAKDYSQHVLLSGTYEFWEFLSKNLGALHCVGVYVSVPVCYCAFLCGLCFVSFTDTLYSQKRLVWPPFWLSDVSWFCRCVEFLWLHEKFFCSKAWSRAHPPVFWFRVCDAHVRYTWMWWLNALVSESNDYFISFWCIGHIWADRPPVTCSMTKIPWC